MQLDGLRRRVDGLYARPRYRCVHHGNCNATCAFRRYRGKPVPCRGLHVFTEAEQARTHDHPEGMWCRECDRDRGERDTTPVAHAWDFEARLIADSLLAVGQGSSFRDAASRMRVGAHRYPKGGDPSNVSHAGETVHRYLDHFGRLVLDEIEPQEWPPVLLLDAHPLRKREERDDDPFSHEISGNGAVLVAYGYIGPFPRRRHRKRDAAGKFEPLPELKVAKMRPKAWKMAVAGGVDRYSWHAFLASLPGTPRWIVVDGDDAVRLAIQMQWGTGPGAPIIYSCEGHLQERFRHRALTQDHLPGRDVERLWPKHDGSANPSPGPLWSRDAYRQLLDRVLAYPPADVVNISSWLRYHDRVIQDQFVLRDEFPGLPRSIGALEGGLTKVRDWLGKRTRRLQNVRRINIMLGLMRANLALAANAGRYSKIIRAELERSDGRPQVDWRLHHYKGHVSGGGTNPVGSLFRLADDARDEVGYQRPNYWVSKQASSMQKKLAEMNHIHFTLGAPLLELTGGEVPSVRVKGMHIDDFPTFFLEWDPANERDPYATAAGHGYPVGWICAVDPSHRWRSAPSVRLGRLQGCPKCKKRRGVAELLAGLADEGLARAAIQAIRDRLGPYEDAAALAAIPAIPAIPAAVQSPTAPGPSPKLPPIRRPTPAFAGARFPVVIVDDGPDEVPFADLPVAVGSDPDFPF